MSASRQWVLFRSLSRDSLCHLIDDLSASGRSVPLLSCSAKDSSFHECQSSMGPLPFGSVLSYQLLPQEQDHLQVPAERKQSSTSQSSFGNAPVEGQSPPTHHTGPLADVLQFTSPQRLLQRVTSTSLFSCSRTIAVERRTRSQATSELWRQLRKKKHSPHQSFISSLTGRKSTALSFSDFLKTRICPVCLQSPMGSCGRRRHGWTMLNAVCHDVTTEPPLQPLTGEAFIASSVKRDDQARLDISACGFWGGRFEKAFFDVRVLTQVLPRTNSLRCQPPTASMRRRSTAIMSIGSTKLSGRHLHPWSFQPQVGWDHRHSPSIGDLRTC